MAPAGLPEGEGKSGRFGTPDPLFDAVRIVTARETGTDGAGDGAGAPGWTTAGMTPCPTRFAERRKDPRHP